MTTKVLLEQRMTAAPDSAPAPAPAATSYLDTIAVYLRPRVLIVMFLGFSAGLPLALTGSTIQVWSAQSGVDLKTIGFFTLVGTPYTLKFLWAPIVDAIDVPILSQLLGRRRGWLVFSQLLLMATIVFLAFCDPAISPWTVALAALLIATASATQDIVIDAFRVESLDKNEQAAGMASYVAAYRIGMLASTVGVLYLVAAFELFGFATTAAWTLSFIGMAVLVLVGVITTIAATEPQQSAIAEAAHAGEKNSVTRVAQAAYQAFADFLTRDAAIVVLLFVVFYKFCDAFAGVMTAAFIIKIGFSVVDYANIVKGVGLAATLIGGFGGGVLAARYSLARADRPEPLGAGGRDHRGEFHWRDRHRDLRRLPLGAMPEPAAHRDPVCLADGARRGRAHLSVGGRRHCRGGDRLADVLRGLIAARDPEPAAARLAAAARAFFRPRTRTRRPRRRLSHCRASTVVCSLSHGERKSGRLRIEIERDNRGRIYFFGGNTRKLSLRSNSFSSLQSGLSQ
jgi:PAT family beta-lactamase induction signal transducer AmpG